MSSLSLWSRTLLGLSIAFVAILTASPSRAGDSPALTLVVMDPLAAPLSCPCVKGYAQRNYKKLGEFLSRELERPVRVVFNESLAKAIEDEDSAGRADIVIGKRSVVAAHAAKSSIPLKPILALTGKDGLTTQTGLIVVGADDPAQDVKGLAGYRIVFGTSDCDEKYAAPLELLKKNGIDRPEEIETCSACSDGATLILELGPKARAATVISSYAAPLLEGCGTIKKGDLRVVGTTEPVPFISAFVSEKLSEQDRGAILEALKETTNAPALLAAIESKRGFVSEESPAIAKSAENSKKKN